MTLLIEGTTIPRDVCCSDAARLLALQDLLTYFRGIIIIVTNPSKSVEVHVPFGPSAAVCLYMILVLYLTISNMVQVTHIPHQLMSQFTISFRFDRHEMYNLLQWRTEGGFGVFQPPPEIPKFSQIQPDCKLSRKYVVFLFQHSY